MVNFRHNSLINAVYQLGNIVETSNDVAIQIAQLNLQVTSLFANVEKMDGKLDQLVSLDRTIAEMNVRHEASTTERTAMWQKVDLLNQWKELHIRDDIYEHSALGKILESNNKELIAACTLIEGKVDGWINKGKGALWVASLSLGFIQVCVLGAMAWTFNHVSILESKITVIETRLNSSQFAEFKTFQEVKEEQRFKNLEVK